MNGNYRDLMVGLVLLLAIIKFVFVPVYQHQQEQLTQLTALSKKLEKATALSLSEEALTEQVKSLQQHQLALEQQLPKVSNFEELAPLLQGKWQLQLEQAGISVLLFNWVGYQQIGQSKQAVGRVNMRLSGPLAQLIPAVNQIFKQYPHIRIVEAVNSQNSAMISDAAFEVYFTLDVLYQVSSS